MDCIDVGSDMFCVMVAVMSADDGKSVVMKGVTHGACDYLIKPVRIEALKNIWQHVVRKRKNEWKDAEQSGSAEEGDRHPKASDEADYSSSANEGSWRNSKKRRDEEEEAEDRDDTSTLKKPRVVWSVELHQQFVAAVDQLGIDSMHPSPGFLNFFFYFFSFESVAFPLKAYVTELLMHNRWDFYVYIVQFSYMSFDCLKTTLLLLGSSVFSHHSPYHCI